jgi:hypothetical protein
MAEEGAEKEDEKEVYFPRRWSRHIDKVNFLYSIYCYHGEGGKAMTATGGIKYSPPGNLPGVKASK